MTQFDTVVVVETAKRQSTSRNFFMVFIGVNFASLHLRLLKLLQRVVHDSGYVAIDSTEVRMRKD